ASIRNLKDRLSSLAWSNIAWIDALPSLEVEVAEFDRKLARDESASSDIKWWARELYLRVYNANKMVEDLAPWLSPRFAACWDRDDILHKLHADDTSLETLPEILEIVAVELQNRAQDESCTAEIRSAIDFLFASLSKPANI